MVSFFRPLILLFFVVATLVLACKKELEPGIANSVNAITGNASVTGITEASVSVDGSRYTSKVPARTNVTALALKIPLASGAGSEPNPEVRETLAHFKVIKFKISPLFCYLPVSGGINIGRQGPSSRSVLSDWLL